jgi:uncharacterized protein YcfJ
MNIHPALLVKLACLQKTAVDPMQPRPQPELRALRGPQLREMQQKQMEQEREALREWVRSKLPTPETKLSALGNIAKGVIKTVYDPVTEPQSNDKLLQQLQAYNDIYANPQAFIDSSMNTQNFAATMPFSGVKKGPASIQELAPNLSSEDIKKTVQDTTFAGLRRVLATNRRTANSFGRVLATGLLEKLTPLGLLTPVLGNIGRQFTSPGYADAQEQARYFINTLMKPDVLGRMHPDIQNLLTTGITAEGAFNPLGLVQDLVQRTYMGQDMLANPLDSAMGDWFRASLETNKNLLGKASVPNPTNTEAGMITGAVGGGVVGTGVGSLLQTGQREYEKGLRQAPERKADKQLDKFFKQVEDPNYTPNKYAPDGGWGEKMRAAASVAAERDAAARRVETQIKIKAPLHRGKTTKYGVANALGSAVAGGLIGNSFDNADKSRPDPFASIGRE